MLSVSLSVHGEGGGGVTPGPVWGQGVVPLVMTWGGGIPTVHE